MDKPDTPTRKGNGADAPEPAANHHATSPAAIAERRAVSPQRPQRERVKRFDDLF